MRLLAALLLLIAAPLAAQTDLGAWVSFVRTGTTDAGEGVELDFDEGMGYGLTLNQHLSPRFSVELGASQLTTEDGVASIGGVEAFALGELELRTATATAQFHLIHTSHLDAYVGAGGAYVTADDLESGDLDTLGIGAVEIDSQFTWTAQAGATFFLTDRIGIGADAKYLSYSPDSTAAGDDEPVELELDPWILSAGIRIRW